ncbi:Uncharacterized protein Adt_39204 [Abeliophyllum distichum]|uniref:Uncharacterized protein n=1 Tax=Abeliophyllum distichum TaxID=126358 RepID=A0ABD1Q642_9LAMI
MALENLYMKLTIEDEEQCVEPQRDSNPQETDEYRYCLDTSTRLVKHFTRPKEKILNNHTTLFSELYFGTTGLASKRWLQRSSLEVSKSNSGRDMDYDAEKETPTQDGRNHSLAMKGKGVMLGSNPSNPIPTFHQPFVLYLKENPLFKEGAIVAPFNEGNDNMGITILDQKRR